MSLNTNVNEEISTEKVHNVDEEEKVQTPNETSEGILPLKI